MHPHQIDHLLEQIEVIVGVPHAAADRHALPGVLLQGGDDDGLNVIAVVETYEARRDAHSVLGELGQSCFDLLHDGLGIPRSGDPARVEADDQDAQRRFGAHGRTVTRATFTTPALARCVEEAFNEIFSVTANLSEDASTLPP